MSGDLFHKDRIALIASLILFLMLCTFYVTPTKPLSWETLEDDDDSSSVFSSESDSSALDDESPSTAIDEQTEEDLLDRSDVLKGGDARLRDCNPGSLSCTCLPSQKGIGACNNVTLACYDCKHCSPPRKVCLPVWHPYVNEQHKSQAEHANEPEDTEEGASDSDVSGGDGDKNGGSDVGKSGASARVHLYDEEDDDEGHVDDEDEMPLPSSSAIRDEEKAVEEALDALTDKDESDTDDTLSSSERRAQSEALDVLHVESKPPCDMLDKRMPYANGSWVPAPKREHYWIPCPTTTNVSHVNETFCFGQGHELPNLIWEPLSCHLEPFNAKRLLDRLGRRHLTFVGDAITGEHFYNLACAIEQADAGVLVNSRRLLHPADLSDIMVSTHVTFAVTPFLYECPLCHTTDVIATDEFSSDSNAAKEPAIDFTMLHRSWADRLQRRRSVLVINVGTWFSVSRLTALGFDMGTPEEVETLFETTMDFLFNTSLPKLRGVAVIRAIAPAHSGCSASDGDERPSHPSWEAFERRNSYVRRLVRHYTGDNVYFLDVWTPSLSRRDAHLGAVLGNADCLHWCSPGPNSVVNVWSQLLFNLLMQIFAPDTED